MAHDVTLIPGDDTGPEPTEAARRVLEDAGISIEPISATGPERIVRRAFDHFADSIVNLCNRSDHPSGGSPGSSSRRASTGHRLGRCAAMIGGPENGGRGEHRHRRRRVRGDARIVADVRRDDRTNPAALVPSGVHMFDHQNETAAARALENAIAAVVRKGEKVTYDLKPSRTDPTAVGTSELADAAIEEMNA